MCRETPGGGEGRRISEGFSCPASPPEKTFPLPNFQHGAAGRLSVTPGDSRTVPPIEGNSQLGLARLTVIQGKDQFSGMVARGGGGRRADSQVGLPPGRQKKEPWGSKPASGVRASCLGTVRAAEQSQGGVRGTGSSQEVQGTANPQVSDTGQRNKQNVQREQSQIWGNSKRSGTSLGFREQP